MLKVTDKWKIFGLFVPVTQPETAEEFDQIGGAGSCLANALQYQVFHRLFNVGRDKFTEALAKETGIERLTKDTGKTKKAEDGVTDEPILEWDEKEAVYVARVLATLASQRGVDEVLISEFQHLADGLDLTVDPRSPERKPSGPKKLSKRYLDAAQQVIDAGNAEKWVAKYGGDGSLEVIAGKIRELQLAEEAKQDLAAKFV